MTEQISEAGPPVSAGSALCQAAEISQEGFDISSSSSFYHYITGLGRKPTKSLWDQVF